MLPYIFEVCVGTFLSDCQDAFSLLTRDCDPDHEFGNKNVVCDIPSKYGLPFCVVLWNLLQQDFFVIAETQSYL